MYRGLMIAKAFANQGAKVYVTGRRVDVLKQATDIKLTGNGSIHWYVDRIQNA